MKKPGESFEKLVGTMRSLLGPGGCSWDRRQTHRTLLKFMREEADEVAAAVKKKDWDNLCEELGDLLLQVVFQAELARGAGRFEIGDVVEGINSKLVRRHPHVFKKKKNISASAVVKQWEAIKALEKRAKKSG